MSFLGQDEQIREYQFRFRYLYTVLAITFTTLFARLWYLQIMYGERYRQYSEENRIKKVMIRSPRGMIFDRNKKLLVDNRPAFDLEITPQELYASKDWKQTTARLSRMIRINSEEILKILEKAKHSQEAFRPVRIKQDLTNEEVAIVEAHKLDLPGVSIDMDMKRANLYKDLGAHLVGYIGEINPNELPKLNKSIGLDGVPYKAGTAVGKAGLEIKWESVLRGIDGEEYIEVDALGHRKKATTKGLASSLKTKPSTPGKNLILTIDQDLQNAARQSFEKLFGSKKIGAVIALNPKSGEVLAAVSEPSFDPTEFSRGISPQIWNELINNEFRPLRDKTIQDHYSPGSTFKIFTAIAGLEKGVIDENTTFHCSGNMRLGNRIYHCWRKKGHGSVNVVNAIIQSCDVFFYRLSQKLGMDAIAKYATEFGLGRKTGIHLSHEEPGLIPTEEWKKNRFNQEWIPGETLTCAIGQSYVLTTPIQLASAYAAIATGGDIWKPFIVKYIENSNGRILKEFIPEKISTANINKKTFELIQKGLLGVVNNPNGTSYSNRIPGIDASGKTGTSQVIRIAEDKIYHKCENMPFHLRNNGIFVAYAPPDDPAIAVAVVAEHACHGASGAAPIAFALIKTYLQKIMPEKYGEEALKEKLKKIVASKPKPTEIQNIENTETGATENE